MIRPRPAGSKDNEARASTFAVPRGRARTRFTVASARVLRFASVALRLRNGAAVAYIE